MESNSKFLSLIYPELVILLSILILTLFSFARDRGNICRGIMYLALTFNILFVAINFNLYDTYIFNQHLVITPFTQVTKIVLMLIVTFFIGQLSYYDSSSKMSSEVYILLLFALLGSMFLVSSSSLLSMYVALELQSLSIYSIIALSRNNRVTNEASIKYLVLGILSSAIILYGISYVYGFSGSIMYAEISNYLVKYYSNNNLGIMFGITLILCGIFFKLSIVPFHVWLPDIYQGSRIPVTSILATLPKVSLVIALLNIVIMVLYEVQDKFQDIFIFGAVLSMLVGSISAVRQNNIKRLLAYSYISHIGFVMMSLVVINKDNFYYVLLYIVVYSLLTMSLFAVAMLVKCTYGKSDSDLLITDFSGLAKRFPFIALMALFSLFSMSGIPPFAGFWIKFWVLDVVISDKLYYLAVVAIISSIISAYYYLKIIKAMYFDQETSTNVAMAGKSLGISSSNVTLVLFVIFVLNALFVLLFPYLNTLAQDLSYSFGY